MSRKCKYCYSALKDGQSVCSVCKIDSTKDKSQLTKEEKKINYYCRALYTIASLTVLGGIVGLIGTVPQFFETPWDFNVPLEVFDIIIDCLILAYGISLMNYKRYCYIAGIIIYGLSIVLSLISINIITLLLGILFLSYVASPTSKKILYREL
ncbi:MAG: hypothetical protein PHR23_06710 [bacterium]|nr:hypothetical protein [bacterium]